MCDDVSATVEELRAKGAMIAAPITDEGWGLLTSIDLPGAGSIGLYESRHASPLPRKTGRK